MLTRPFTRLVVAFGIRKITQRRLVEEVVIGTIILIPFGALVGLITSRICTKIQISGIRSDVWTTLVVFLIGDILMEWLLPSLGCLPVPSAPEGERDEVDEYVSSIFHSSSAEGSSSAFFPQDEFHYNLTWLLQSYGLYCPENFANSDSLLTPDATAILFSIRLIFLCIGVHIGESLGCFVALTGGIATGKSTAAKMFVDYNYYSSESLDDSRFDGNNQSDNNTTRNNNAVKNRRNNYKRPSNKKRNNDAEDDELMKLARAKNEETVGILQWLWNLITGFFSAILSFAFTDDSNGNVVYSEGTVQLVCADSIAHNILLPPEVLEDKAAKLTSSMMPSDDDEDSDEDYASRDDGDEDENDSDDEGDNGDRNATSNEDQNPILRIVSPSDSVYYRIIKAFDGNDIVNPKNGHIDRLKLGAIIFNDRDERKKLNRITHPKILSVLLKKLVRSVFFGYADITMGDLPLLFESGKLSWLFGVTVCVTTSKEIQLRRLMQRNPELPKEECQARIDSQMSLTRKVKLADIVIDNNGDLEQLREQVEEARRDIMGRLYGIGMSLLQMLLLIGGSTSIAVSSKFYTHWQQ